MSEEKRPQPVPVPPARPKMASISGSARQAPTPLKVPGAGSPRPPMVAPVLAAREPSAPAVGEAVTAPGIGGAGMSAIAMEATLAELTSWRREAEKKIARLEAELAQVQTIAAAHRAIAPTAPIIPVPAPSAPAAPKEPLPPWAPQPAFATATPIAPAPPAAPVAPVASVIVEPEAAPAAPAAPAIPPARSTQATEPPSLVARPQRHQYDLSMRPGEAIDLPTGLDGGRRQKVMGWFVMLMIFGGMAALVASALMSQR